MAEWKVEIDNCERMLKCSSCGNRVFEESYLHAVGE